MLVGEGSINQTINLGMRRFPVDGWVGRGTILCLLPALLAANELLDKHSQRLLAAADPFLGRGDTINVNVEGSEEAKFSRDAVEAAPDSLKTVTFR